MKIVVDKDTFEVLVDNFLDLRRECLDCEFTVECPHYFDPEPDNERCKEVIYRLLT